MDGGPELVGGGRHSGLRGGVWGPDQAQGMDEEDLQAFSLGGHSGSPSSQVSSLLIDPS